MAITETTKREVFRQREVIRQRMERREEDIANLKEQAEKLRLANIEDKIAYDALKKDVPAPTPVEPE